MHLGEVHHIGHWQGFAVYFAPADDAYRCIKLTGAGDGGGHCAGSLAAGRGPIGLPRHHDVGPARQRPADAVVGAPTMTTGWPRVSCLKCLRSSGKRQGSWPALPMTRLSATATTIATIIFEKSLSGLGRQFEAAQELAHFHTFLAFELHIQQIKPAIGGGHAQIILAIGGPGAGYCRRRCRHGLGAEYLENAAIGQGGKGRRHWREATKPSFTSSVAGRRKIEATGFFLQLGGGAGISYFRLRNAGRGTGRNRLHRAAGQRGPGGFELVVKRAEIIGRGNGQAVLKMRSPVSISWRRKKLVTPVSVSPCIKAQLMGAAPRYWGNREA